MSQIEEERALDRFKPGNIKPSVKLRESLQEADKCKDFFLKGGFIEYLNSINQFYFGGNGKIVGPESLVTTSIDQNTQVIDGVEESDLLDLDDDALGGIQAYVEFEERVSILKIVKKHISILLKYQLKNDAYLLSLHASWGKDTGEENAIQIGKYSRKTFYLNPNVRIQSDIDDLLLTFTGELLEARIL